MKRHLTGRNVAFLLGAGSSHLDGTGYPLGADLWEAIRQDVPKDHRKAVQGKLDGGATGLEHALDLLDDGGASDTPYRHTVIEAIAQCFSKVAPPLDVHARFLQRFSQRTDRVLPVFSLNYDPLPEWAAERTRVRLVDGFVGAEHAFFDPAVFQQDLVVLSRRPRWPTYTVVTGTVRLFKLHGSLGWYECSKLGIRRCSFCSEPPSDTRRLMVPPQRRKATDTMTLPYASLWSEFRGALRHGPQLANRLVVVGYGMGDEHVNPVIESALARANLTLLVFAKELSDEAFARWSRYANAIVVTAARCSLCGQVGSGHDELWRFEHISQEI